MESRRVPDVHAHTFKKTKAWVSVGSWLDMEGPCIIHALLPRKWLMHLLIVTIT